MSEQKKSSIGIEHFSLYYPGQVEKTLDDLTLTMKRGKLLVLCGPSGCGKSMSLRQLKTVPTPHGRQMGHIHFEGQPLEELDQREQSVRIGFMQQSPENQIATDRVWHELAFGLESLGYDTPTIRRQVVEIASFFGIQTRFYKNITELSGGRKQLLNLASIMAVQPSALTLGEPTNQFDSIAAIDLLATLGKISRELGTTVVLTEHRLGDVSLLTSRMAIMDRGRLFCTGDPAEVGAILCGAGHSMFLAIPTPMRVQASAPDAGGHCPVAVWRGRDRLTKFAGGHPLMELSSEPRRTYPNEPAITAEGLWLKYEKELSGMMKGLNLAARRSEFLVLLDGNGAGKIASLKLLSGLQESYRGEVRLAGSAGALSQNPQMSFVKKTVREDFFKILKGRNFPGEAQKERVAWAVWLCRLEGLLNRHLYDLSGGERQQAALARVFLLGPEILLTDGSTKGLDAEFKRVFVEILQSLLRRGVTPFTVSHDIEFYARYAHRCALSFDGSAVMEVLSRAFSSGNNLYTTSANRMACGLLPEAVTVEDVIRACGGNLLPAPELSDSGEPLPESEEASAGYKPKSLPWWHKLGVVPIGTVSFLLFLSFMSATDLIQLITADGMTELASHQMILYTLFILSLFLLATCIIRRSRREDYTLRVSKAKRRLVKRTVAAAVLVPLMTPLTPYIGVFYPDNKKYYFISLLVLLECMLPFFLIFGDRELQVREPVIIAVLCVIGIIRRAAFFMLPQLKPVMTVTIIIGVAFGGEIGFLVGAVTIPASSVLFG